MRAGRFVFLLLVGAAVTPAYAAKFLLTSPQIKAGGTIAKEQVFNSFGCTGDNVSPALHWTGAPAGTKSFAVTMYDPDAPTGSGWWHWVMFNIPDNVTALTMGAGDPTAGLAPAGSVEGRTDYGSSAYGGPCRPAGSKPHNYIITVYALKLSKIPLGSDASGALVGFYLHQNMLAKATLEAKYGR